MESTSASPKEIRPASTVILVREQEEELQVYLLKRSTGSGFFPGNYVFPGGALDPDDQQIGFWQHHVDLSAEERLKVFGAGVEAEGIIAYGVAAIRETLEEAGVFLARGKNAAQGSFEGTGQRPLAGALREGWFQKKCSDEGWLLSFSNLFPWSHWITPLGMPKRFDTRFFIALMPEGQVCSPDDQETVHGLWINPGKGLQGNMRGELPLSPPTVITLHELLPFKTLAGLIKASRLRSWGDPRLPILMKLAQGAVIVEPWDPQYGKAIQIDPAGLSEKVAPIGEPFSRIWLNKGIWRPLTA